MEATYSRSRLTGNSNSKPCWARGSGEPGPIPSTTRPGAASASAAHVIAVSTAPLVYTLIAALPNRTRLVSIASAVSAVTESRVMRVSACQSDSNPASSAARPISTSDRRSGPPRNPSPGFTSPGRPAGSGGERGLTRYLIEVSRLVRNAAHRRHGRRAHLARDPLGDRNDLCGAGKRVVAIGHRHRPRMARDAMERDPDHAYPDHPVDDSDHI